MRGRLALGLTILTLSAIGASPAWAHAAATLHGGFVSGLMHPLGGLDHLMAMVAVGLWGAFLGRPLVVALPVIFPSVMAVGGVLGMISVPMPPIELGIAVSVLMLGLLIAAAARAPIWVASILVGVFAVFHGYAHGQELPVAADPVGYSVGFVVATGLLHVAGIAIGTLNARRGGPELIRGLGVVIAGAGAYFLYAATLA